MSLSKRSLSSAGSAVIAAMQVSWLQSTPGYMTRWPGEFSASVSALDLLGNDGLLPELLGFVVRFIMMYHDHWILNVLAIHLFLFVVRRWLKA